MLQTLSTYFNAKDDDGKDLKAVKKIAVRSVDGGDGIQQDR
jgi:hypothetical protein